MKNLYTLLLASLCFCLTSLYAENKSTQNESLTSSQLLGCNSLKNLKSFAIHPQYSIHSPGLRDKINAVIVSELEKIGYVIKLTAPDVTGYGKSQARITMIFKDISSSKGQKFPISEISLLISSPTIIEKTNVKCSIYIWSLHAFIEGNIEDANASNILDSLKTSLAKFIDEYNDINNSQKEKMVFYLYSN